jgi:hypothetical protein
MGDPEGSPTGEPDHGSITSGELARLRRIEDAAGGVLDAWDGSRRSPTPMLTAIAALRAALNETPEGIGVTR